MDRDLLQACGEALFGPRWQTDIANELKVSDRSIRRWASGEPIPDGIWADLRRIIGERIEQLKEVRQKLPR